MADKALDWLDDTAPTSPDKPFFMYWAPGAVHGPHHVFKEWADKYKGKFDDGWDAYRERVFERQKRDGLDSGEHRSSRRATRRWRRGTAFPRTSAPFQQRLMELFAGFVEHTDTQVGRLIDELERAGSATTR